MTDGASIAGGVVPFAPLDAVAGGVQPHWRRQLLVVAAIVALYLPLLWAPFDFSDDGNLVYPTPPMALRERAALTWQKIVANYEHLGPFRPVLWLHWELAAELLGADAVRWRLCRMTWLALSCAELLWLLRELRLGVSASAVATALAVWSAAPSEIWRSLTLSEGVAMPYALGALICAVRGGRSARPARWDLAGALCALAALGCKNTFAAIVPAQLLLRVAPDGEAFAAAIRQRGRRAVLLALPLLLPMIHFAIFQRGWHPGQYVAGLPRWRQFAAMLDRVQAGVSLWFVAPALIAALLALISADARSHGSSEATTPALRRVWRHHRAANRAALALLVFGIGIYLPMPSAAGRYAIPALWGAVLLIAALASEAEHGGERRWTMRMFVLFGVALTVVAVGNLSRQEKFIARNAMLWDALYVVEQQAGRGDGIAWQSGPDLGLEEGIHFFWHLQRRGRADLAIQLLDGAGQVQLRPEVPTGAPPPTFVLTGPRDTPALQGAWTVTQRFSRSFRFGLRQFDCLVWRRSGG